MIKYKIEGKASKSQHDEVEEYLRDPTFMRLLKLTNNYYVQGYYGDYGFIGEYKLGNYVITVTLY